MPYTTAVDAASESDDSSNSVQASQGTVAALQAEGSDLATSMQQLILRLRDEGPGPLPDDDFANAFEDAETLLQELKLSKTTLNLKLERIGKHMVTSTPQGQRTPQQRINRHLFIFYPRPSRQPHAWARALTVQRRYPTSPLSHGLRWALLQRHRP